MNKEAHLRRKAAIYEMGLLFNQHPNDQRIEAYAKHLASYSPEQITYAFNKVIESGSGFFPSLAEILKHLRPVPLSKEDQAPMIVTEMLTALRDHSQYDEAKMLDSVSDIARAAFIQLGSTYSVRVSENIETTKAQLERLVKGVIARGQQDSQGVELQKLGLQNGKVINLVKDRGIERLNYSDFLPPGEGA